MTKEEYVEKVNTLREWAFSYYVLNEPVVEDDGYDELYHIVLEYEKENPSDIISNSPTQHIGETELVSGFQKAKHITKMYSMEDVFTDAEMEEWMRKIPAMTTFVSEPKLDGLSLNLKYNDGVLVEAVTRGDGLVGDNVISNARLIDNIPQTITLKDLIEIRGEVVILKDHLEVINNYRIERGEDELSNVRNAAAGALRNQNPDRVKEANLKFYIWGVGENILKEKTYTARMKLLQSYGFEKYGDTNITNTHGEVLYQYLTMSKNRKDMNVALDGMVVKVDDVSLQNELGYTNKFPRWMVAFKFKAIKYKSKIESVIHQTGRTGVITPVAIITPTDIDGVTVSRVTLHNYNDVKRKDLRINDEIYIIRSGDVIPKIVGVDKDKRDGGEIPIVAPNTCPSCSKPTSDIETEKNGVVEYTTKCMNIVCPAVVTRSIARFASRKCLNIDGLGIKIIEELVDKKIISNPLDLYDLTYEDLSKLDNFKEKRINKLLKAIENSKGADLDKVIASLGIVNVGTSLSPILAKEFGLNILEATYDKLLNIPGIGEETINGILHFINDNEYYILKILKILKPSIPKKVDVKDSVISGKKVLVTGKFTRTRDEMKEYLISLGAIPVSSVSKNTDLVIWGGDKSSKVTKAEKLGILVWDENEFKVNIEE